MKRYVRTKHEEVSVKLSTTCEQKKKGSETDEERGGEEGEVEVDEKTRDNKEGGEEVNRGTMKLCLLHVQPPSSPTQQICACCSDPTWFSSRTGVSLSDICVQADNAHRHRHTEEIRDSLTCQIKEKNREHLRWVCLSSAGCYLSPAHRETHRTH